MHPAQVAPLGSLRSALSGLRLPRASSPPVPPKPIGAPPVAARPRRARLVAALAITAVLGSSCVVSVPEDAERYSAQGDECVAGESGLCGDGNLCTTETCDDHGKCVSKANEGDCDDGDLCSEGDVCAGGKCVAGVYTVCADGGPCTDAACVAGAGCSYKPNTGPCDDDNACTAGDACTEGACKPGVPVNCDDGNLCTADNCDLRSGCKRSPRAAPCSDSSNCTQGDACEDGKCAAGKPKECVDGNLCTDDGCNANTGCVNTPNKESCDDGSACTAGDACKDGACVPGEPAPCDDGNPCTTEVCVGPSGCESEPNSLGCNDASACTVGDACEQGNCEGGSMQDCDDGNPCTTNGCDPQSGCVQEDSTLPCNDGNNCTVGDLCAGGACVPGKLANCDDGNPCSTDVCDKQTGCVWLPNVDSCDDGNACMVGDACKDGKCLGGASLTCDDGNDCTNADCDPKSGCTQLNNSVPCNDGSKCTVGDMCKAGSCLPGKLANCDDGNPCTTDACDGQMGCKWTPNQLDCDDGNKCTVGDVCKQGACFPGKPTDCDDADGCTKDACADATGQCEHTSTKGCGSCKTDSDCGDANACSDDKCDAKSGKCATTPNTKPCDSDDPCTWGDTCDGKGNCVTAKNPTCDDGNDCTLDKCDAKTGACAYDSLADGTACSDDKACTSGDACLAGKCVYANAECPLYSEAFDCPWDNQSKGWLLQGGSGNSPVAWQVDKTPKIDGAKGCMLNYNDGTDYCQPLWGNTCHAPGHSAYTPLIDASTTKGTPHIKFRTYCDLDLDADTDRPWVGIYADSKILYGFTLPKNDMKKWHDIDLAVPNIKGNSSIRLRFRLENASGQSDNQGKGWFVDDLVITAPEGVATPPEACDNGKDDDGDSKTDCLDVDCKGKPICAEMCDDGKDNDYDDKIDCADPDCSSHVACQPPLFEAKMDCGSGGWTYSAAKNGVAFAIDSAPNTVNPVSGSCTLNFNNGSNFCGTANCNDNSTTNGTAGTAVVIKQIDATGLATLWAEYWSYQWGQDPTGVGAYYDVGLLQVSTDGFKGCCSGSIVCSTWSSEFCNSAQTASFFADKSAGAWKAWAKVKVDLKDWAGKKFKLRYRFTSRGPTSNDHPGWFIDDLRVYGSK